MAKEKRGDEEFRHQISCSEDEKLWLVAVNCDAKITPEEFGAVLISLGKDVLEGKIDFSKAADAEENGDFQ